MFPIISVIIPVYNAEQTISDSIKSILEQSYNNFEIIIIDDGSTDNTVEIIKKFSDKRIMLYEREHRGPGAQRNFGIRLSKGEFIAFLDADDIACMNRFEIQMMFMQKNSDIEILGTQAIFIDSDSKKISNYDAPITDINYFFPINCPIITSTIVFRKSIIEKVGFFSEKLEPATDYEWLIIANQKGICIKNLRNRLTKVRNSVKSFTKLNRIALFNKMLYLTNLQIEDLYKNKFHDYDYFFRKGLIEYYYGSSNKSILFFLKSIWQNPTKILTNLRYVFPSLLGNNLLLFLRNKKITLLFNKFLQRFGKNISYLR